MIPRGEVGLIFASIGQQLVVGGVPLVSRETFAALVVMVVVTTLASPLTVSVLIALLQSGF